MITRGRRTLTLTLLVAALAGAALVASHAATSRPLSVGGGTVGGKVTAASEVPLTEMVVYLEPEHALPAAGATAGEKLPRVAVRQKGAKFDPPLLIISVGQTVDFLNDEDKPIEHNVFSNAPAKKFDLGLYPPPQSKSVTFDKPGAVFLYCSIHRFMDGVVYVCPTPYHSRVAADGTYRIENVPPGKYHLKTWQRRRRFPEKSEAVAVVGTPAQTVNLELRRP